MLLYAHRDHKDYKGRGAQDVHLDFHTQLLNSGFCVALAYLNIQTLVTQEYRFSRRGHGR